MNDFFPRDVVTSDPVPLTATFGRAELEVAAAYLVIAMCHDSGTFRPVDPAQVGAARRARLGQRGFTWLENPFAVPDFDGLIKGGFAEWTEPKLGRCSPIAFTPRGLEILRSSRWVSGRGVAT